MASWSDLPQDLLARIGKRLDTDVDVLRFRSVCKSWRSSTPPFHTSSIFPIKLPLPNPPQLGIPQTSPPRGFFHVTRSIIYRLQPTQQPSSSQKAFLVRFEEKDHPKKWLAFCPFSGHPRFESDSKVLNLLDFRISEVINEYTPHNYPFHGHEVFCPEKVVVVVYSNKCSGGNYAAMAIFGRGRLCFIKSGDEHWTFVDPECCDYVDVIEYKGNFCAIKKNGRAIAVDSSSRVTEIASEFRRSSELKQLVESFGDLILMHGDGWSKVWSTIKVRLYKLDESEGKWVQLRSLGDRILCLFPHLSYSVYACDLAGFEGNQVYYADSPLTRVSKHDGKIVRDKHPGKKMLLVLNLEDGKNCSIRRIRFSG